MKNISLYIITIFISLSSFSQLKKISLSDAVLQQNRLFRADKLTGFQWIPDTDKYIYFAENGTKLMTANAIDNIASEIISLSTLNKNLNSELKSFYGIQFKKKGCFPRF